MVSSGVLARTAIKLSVRLTPGGNLESERPRVIALLSGGIDSACLVAHSLKAGHPVDALFIGYGQPAEASERKSAEALAAHFNITLRIETIHGGAADRAGMFMARNAAFVLLAAAAADARPLLVGLGIHDGCPYYDTTPAFVDDMQRILDGYSGGSIRLFTPFATVSKADVLAMAEHDAVPVHLSYSCERQSDTPCGECPSCQDRRGIDRG